MKLSMWQLADWLNKYNPILKIQEGESVIRNIRFLSEDIHLSPLSVYLGFMEEDAEAGQPYILCTNRKDMILLPYSNLQDVFNDVLDAFEYYNGWSDNLLEKIHMGCSLQDILEASNSLFHGTLLVCDSGYMVKAFSNIDMLQNSKNKNEMIKNGMMPLESILSINDDPRIRKHLEYSYVMNYEALEKPCICKNLFSRNQHVGWVIGIVDSMEETGIHTRQIMDEIGNLIEAWLNLHDEQLTLASSSELFLDILKENYQSTEAEERKLISIGWYPSDPKELFYIRLTNDQYSLKEILKRRIEYSLKGCFLLDRQTHFVIIRNQKLSPDYTFQKVMPEILKQTGMIAGISPVFHDIFEMKPMLHLAEAAWNHHEKIKGSMIPFEKCALYYTIDVLTEHAYPGFIHPAPGLLQKYDMENGTDLFHSLYAYLENDRNTAETAKKLSLHRNSLQYRLKRIAEITGTDLDDPDTRLHILLSYKLLSN